MDSGMSPLLFGHVAVSLLAIVAGFVILYGLWTANRMDVWTAIFLVTTVLTSASGFVLPAKKLLPSHILGILSLVVLAVAIYARYGKGMGGYWRVTYVTTALFAFYLNFFVLIVQSFLKIPALHALAPNQTEAPFVIAQLAALVFFGGATYVATKRFQPAGPAVA